MPAFNRTDATLSLIGKNIANTAYRVNGTDFGSLGFATAVYGPPREIMVQLNVKY